MNERNTEKLVRDILTAKEYYDSCIVEEQKSENKTINSLLSKASKSGTGIGKPEFIIQPKNNPDTLIIIECKASLSKLKSDKIDVPKDYAVDGAVHYAKALSKNYKVIAIGAVGEKELITESYIVESKEVRPLNNCILNVEDMINLLNRHPKIKKSNEDKVLKFASELHNYLRDYAKLSESEKPLLIGGILIALKDKAFVNSYRDKKAGGPLVKLIVRTIKEQLQDAKMPDSKIKNMIQPYSFIETHPVLSVGDIVGEKEHPLRAIVDQLNDNIMPFINTYSEHDILGHFYGEFLSYTAGDKKGLGIVLTPQHIKELMCELCEVTKDSVVLDTCTGTGGFLITAMDNMIKEANGDSEKIENIKKNQLIGIEQQPNMFALAVSNMILRGDGKANIYNSSCFGIEEEIKKHKPTVALLNPPYSQKGSGLSELDFIYTALECLEPNGLLAAIVPISCGSGNNNLRKKLLKKHTLLGVISMPKVFKDVGVIPGIFIFKAHKPHNNNIKTWFGILKDDGFENVIRRGRIDQKNRWPAIKNKLVKAYKNKEIKAGKYITRIVNSNDEWLGEAYIEPDYSKLKIGDISDVATSENEYIGITINIKVKDMIISKTFRPEKCMNKKLSDLLNIHPIMQGEFGPYNRNQELTYGIGFEEEFKKKYESPLLNNKCKLFKVTDLFDIKKGKGPSLREAKENPGDIPFITATERNNGASCYTSASGKHKGNCLTVACNGSIGCTFYQDKPFCGTSDIHVLNPKFKLTEYRAMFLIPLFEAHKFKYNYGRKWNMERMKNTTIMLPAKDDKVDWEYIDTLVKELVE